MLSARGPSSSTPLRAELRERVRFADRAADDALAGADVARRRAPTARARAGAAAARARRPARCRSLSRLAVYEEVLGEGERGLLFAPGDVDDAGRPAAAAGRRRRLRERLRAPRRRCARARGARVADELEAVYAASSPAATTTRATPDRRAAAPGGALIDVDLHMHTDHSARLRDAGRGAAGHRARPGPRRDRGDRPQRDLRARCEARGEGGEFGVKVIVGEEVKTASQGEVIGLFLTEKIPRGLTLAETVAEIKRQGGLVYVPAPVRPDARGARLRAPARRSSTTSTRSRSTTRAWRSAPSTRRPSASRPSTGSSPAPGRTRTSPRGWARCASACATSTGPEEFLESLRDGRDHHEAVDACCTCRR